MALLHLALALELARDYVPPLAWSDAKAGSVAAMAAYPSTDIADVLSFTVAKDAHGAGLVIAREVHGGYDFGVRVVRRDCLEAALGKACPLVEVQDSGPPRFFAPLETYWASSADCPAVAEILAQIRVFPPTAPSQRGLDGTDYLLWSAGDAGHPGGEVKGWSQELVAVFVDNALGRLQSCWRSEKPVALGR